jgi:hypothetical protein
MTKYLAGVILLVLVAAYLFLFLGIEMDLKFVIEDWGVKANRLIDTSFRIRKFATIQLAIFVAVSIMCMYLVIKRNK